MNVLRNAQAVGAWYNVSCFKINESFYSRAPGVYMYIKITSILTAMLIALLAITGCAGGSNAPTAPGDPVIPDIPKPTAAAGRHLMGMWEISYDLNALSCVVTPLRDAQAHYNITQMVQPPSCYHCLTVVVKEYSKAFHVLHVNVKLYNSLGITGYDVRGIIFTDDYGHSLYNADGWTPLYDIPGGKDINPFKAYLADANPYDYPNRGFLGMVQEVMPYHIKIPTPPEFNKIVFAMDASFPGNCEEPYQLDSYSLKGFYQTDISDVPGSEGYVSIEAHDWQDDITSITFSCPDVIGDTPVECQQGSYNYWTADITNSLGAPPGEYEALFTAHSEGSGDLAMYNLVNLVVKKPLLAPTMHEVPLSAEFPVADICVPGDGYAYAVTGSIYFHRGMHILDVSDPSNPEWINFVEFPVVSSIQSRIEVSGGYAYVAANKLVVVDIDPPAEAHVVTELSTQGADGIAIDGDYCYLSKEDSGLRVVDISNPEAPELVNSLYINTARPGIAVEGNYAYHLTGSGFAVIDIETPESASVVTYAGGLAWLKSIVISDGIAYMAQSQWDGGFAIYDVSDPVHPSLVGKYNLDDYSVEIMVVGQFAYIGHRTCMQIIDVSDIYAPVLLETFATSGSPTCLTHNDGYVYVGSSGLMQVYHCDPPGTAVEVGYHAGLRSGTPACIQDDLLFFNQGGLLITDTDPVESFEVVANVPVYKTWDSEVEGDYAYMCVSPSYTERGLWIVDISNPANPVVIQELILDDKWGYSYITLCADMVFFYTPISDSYLWIIDVSEPGSAYLLYENEPDITWEKFDLYGGIAYLASGVRIYDIDPIEDVHHVSTLHPPINFYDGYGIHWYPQDLKVDGDYLYVLNEDYGFHVFDITSPYSPIEISSIYIRPVEGWNPKDLSVQGNLAYFADRYGIEAIDISDPHHAVFAARYDIPGNLYGLEIGDGYAYARTDDGFRIIEL